MTILITLGFQTGCIGGIFITGIFGNFYTERGGGNFWLSKREFPVALVDRLLATKSEGVWLIVRAVSFQPMWSQITNVTDRGTDDMRSQDRAYALKCIAR